jgi:GT2 family glycosyltransferase
VAVAVCLPLTVLVVLYAATTWPGAFRASHSWAQGALIDQPPVVPADGPPAPCLPPSERLTVDRLPRRAVSTDHFEAATTRPPARRCETGTVPAHRRRRDVERPADASASSRSTASVAGGSPAGLPTVRVVVVNFDGAELTLRCLRSLLQHPPASARQEIVLVDNGSVDGIVWQVRKTMPEVRIIDSLDNLGFAGGCNRGIGDPSEVDFVALLNNDAYVQGDWISPLVRALDLDQQVGAACPKLLFADRYLEVGVRIEASTTPGLDTRSLGLRLGGIEVDGVDVADQVRFDEHWWPTGHDPTGRGHRWSKGDAVFWLPAASAGRTLRMTVGARRATTLSLVVDSVVHAVDVSAEWSSVEVPCPTELVDIVNSAGSSLFTGGRGGDRGFLESDRGQYDDDAEVFAWCGGAVVLRSEYLSAVGTFDERFFLYYEDTDLSWRGRLQGWSYCYVPASVVRHEHAVSTGGEHSAVFRFHVDRNRLLMLVKCAPRRLVVGAYVAATRELARCLWQRAGKATIRKEGVADPHALVRLRSWASAVRMLPAMLADRRALMRRRVVADDDILGWETTR